MKEKKQTTAFTCLSCGAPIKPDYEHELTVCGYCGANISTSELLSDSDAVKMQRIKAATYEKVEMKKQLLKEEQLKIQTKQEEEKKKEEDAKKFKKKKSSKLLVIFAIFSALACKMGFDEAYLLASIVAAIQTLLFLLAWLMGTRVIDAKKWKKSIVTILAFLLFIPYFSFYTSEEYKGMPYKWNDLVLADMLPAPNSKLGEILTNSKATLDINVYRTSVLDFYNYINTCKTNGFTIEGKEDDNSYSAFSQDGYELNLSYYDRYSKLAISLEAPTEMSTIKWPSSAAAKLLPIPNSDYGRISWDYESGFSLRIGKTTKAEYDKYVEACAENGFTIDYSKGDNHYYADNSDGYHLTLHYEGFDTMSICISAPDKQAATDTPAPTSTPAAAATTEPLTIYLQYPELGEYGRYYTFNTTVEKATAEDKIPVIQCFVPVGTYTVTNLSKYPDFVYCYSEETHFTSEGWEEPADGWVSTMMQSGSTCEITIEEGYYIKLLSNQHLKLVQKDTKQ